ncbi:MAG: hypothetical protein OXE75_18635, partial [bacterium]|nr:hypothetical protein [bacterium]
MESNPTRVCELIVGLGDVDVLGVVDEPDGPLVAHIETRVRPPCCGGCGGGVWAKGRGAVGLVGRRAFGRPARLVWRKRRWRCPAGDCAVGSCVGVAEEFARGGSLRPAGAGRWETAAVCGDGRAVSDVAGELGCD